MAEQQTVKSKRDIMMERLKKKYPDKEWADDEALMGQIHDDYDEHDKAIADRDQQISDYRNREDEFVGLLNRNPKAARFMTDLAQDKDPWLELLKREGIDGVTEILNDPERADDFAKANTEYIERIAKEKDLEMQAEKNMAETGEMLASLSEEGKYSPEQIDEALQTLRQIFEDAIVGKISRESIEIVLKAQNHEAAVAAAKSEGEIAGRNSQIEEKLKRPQKSNQTMPQLAGANNRVKRSGTSDSILDLAADA